MSGAIEIDGFEDVLISTKKPFNVLVTTPEKLQLLIRHPGKDFARSVVLTIVDEAHNLSSGSRGLNLEMLLSTIKRDCDRSHLLLLTPFIPNSRDIAMWLDSQNSKSISMELDWKPNDRVVGLYYAKGRGKEISTFFQPLVTSEKTIVLDDEIQIGKTNNFSLTAGKVKHSKYKLTSLLATQFGPSQNFLVLAHTIESAWKTADLIYENLPDESGIHQNVSLVKKFIESELGVDFPLAKYLDKRIGVHHSGIPDEIKNLVEWLMEEGHLRVMVATTTIAQGVNFPVSGILLSSYSYPYKNMPNQDFWNLLGRAGRINQPTLGIIGLAVDKDDPTQMRNVTKYVKKTTEDLVSVLVQMVNDAFDSAATLDLSFLAHDPRWSSFVQYIAHMKKQSLDLGQFVAESELILRQTYGYNQLNLEKQKALLDAVNNYAEKLDKKPHLATLSDLTGFAPETIEGTMKAVRESNIKQDDWNTKNLFLPASEKLATLVGIMLDRIPEIKNLHDITSGQSIRRKTISGIISDWVSGKEIIEIARAHFGKNGASDKDAIEPCVRAIYGKIINSATWGMAGIQKIPGSGLVFDDMPDKQKRQITNLPAMIYYGVDSEEAILMRKHSVPRGISKKIGAAYKDEVGGRDIYSEDTADVLAWLDELSEDKWQPKSRSISGAEYKKIWKRLSGRQT